MNDSPLISVIIPCYNQGRYLTDAIESVLSQSHTNWECIIINDGSTDNTRDVALKYMNVYPQIKYIEQPNRGLSSALNRGIDEAKGDYIQFLDADDLIAPEKLELQCKSLYGISNLKLSYCDFYYCDKNDIRKEVLKGLYPPPKFIMASPLMDMAVRWEDDLSIPSHCFLFDARLFHEHHIRFDEELPNHEDWDCWMKIFALNPVITFVDKKLSIYRVHGSSMSHQRKKMRKGFIMAVKKQQKLFFHNNKEISR
jgi:glycosyltransferase involved in cell wall biosynthesis